MSYSSYVLSLSPVFYLKLDETSGTVAYDSTGNGRQFTYSSVTLNQPSLIESETNGSILLQGTTGSYAMNAALSGMALTEFTLVFFADFGSAASVNQTFLSYASTSSLNEIKLSLNGATNGNLVVRIRGETQTFAQSWRNKSLIVVDWRSSDGRNRVWQDGVIIDTGTQASGVTLTSGGAFVIGQSQGSIGGTFSAPGKGFVDDIALYNSVLTDDQIVRFFLASQAIATGSPAMVSAVSYQLNRVRAWFSEPMSGLFDASNFTIPTLTVTQASPSDGYTYVDLTTTGMIASTNYTLTAGSGVTDADGYALFDNTVDFVSAKVFYKAVTHGQESTVSETVVNSGTTSTFTEAPAIKRFEMRAYRALSSGHVYWASFDNADFDGIYSGFNPVELSDIVLLKITTG